MSMHSAKFLLTLTGRASKCQNCLTGIKGTAFLRHFYPLVWGLLRKILLASLSELIKGDSRKVRLFTVSSLILVGIVQNK